MQTEMTYRDLHGFEDFSTTNIRSLSTQDFNDNVFSDTLKTNPSTHRVHASSREFYINPPRSFSGRMISNDYHEGSVTPNDIVDIEPELKEVRRTGQGYHVQLDLKASAFENFRRPASAQQTRAFSRQLVESTSSHNQYNQMGYLQNEIPSKGYLQNENSLNYITGGRKSVLGLTYENPVSPPIQVHSQALPVKKYDSKTILNLEGSKNNSIINESNNFNDEFIIKSVRQSDSSLRLPAQNDYNDEEDVQFDLSLVGSTINDSRTVVESEVVKSRSAGKKRPVVPASKPKKKHNYFPTAVDDVPVVYNRSKLQEAIPNSDIEEKPRKPETRDAAVEVAKMEMQQKSCNTDPVVECKSVQTFCTSDKPTQTEPEPVVHPKSNGIYLESLSQESQPTMETYTRSSTRGIPIPQDEDYDDLVSYNRIPEESNVDSSIFIQRLLKDAPQGSLRQTTNVEKEEDEIVGPFPKEEVEQMYSNSIINVDSVSEKVDLTLSDGIAHLILKVIYERIVPVKDSVDTFKKSAVVVTKLIDVDLTVTEERRKIYEQVLENHKRNGKLDNKYTFELYKAFVAMADSDKPRGLDHEQLSVEKKIEEEKLWNYDARAASTSGTDSFSMLEKKLSNIDEEPMKLNRQTAFSSSSMTQEYPSYYESLNETEDTSRSASFEWDGHARRSDADLQPESAFNMSRTEKIDQFFPNQYYKAKGVENWKSIYSEWTDEALKASEKYFGSSKDRRLGPRFNVRDYLRPDGNRFSEAGKELFSSTSEKSNIYEAEGGDLTSLEQSVSNEILRKAGLQDGSHRTRMQLYEKVSSP